MAGPFHRLGENPLLGEVGRARRVVDAPGRSGNPEAGASISTGAAAHQAVAQHWTLAVAVILATVQTRGMLYGLARVARVVLV